MALETQSELDRRHQSEEQFEAAFEREMQLDDVRRRKLHKRAANRSRARKFAKTERSGKVRFSVLAVALTTTTVVVVVAMFEILAWLVGG